MILHIQTLITISAVNLILIGVLLQLSGSLFPDQLKGYYDLAAPWQRAMLGGVIYAAVVLPFSTAFANNPGPAGMLQALFNAFFILMMVVLVGGKPLTFHIGLACTIMSFAGLYLAWAVQQA